MSSYTHFTQKERTELAFMKKEGYKCSKIAQLLNKNKSSISREIARNRDPLTGFYHAKRAQEHTNRKRRNLLWEFL